MFKFASISGISIVAASATRSVCLCATIGSKTVSNHFESVSVQMMTIANHLQQDSKLTTLESLGSVLNLNKPGIFQVSRFSLILEALKV